jgi:hypothetical protein
MNERKGLSHLESVGSETIMAIGAAIDSKFNNPTVVREDPSRGFFVLNDADKNGHRKNTTIEISNYDSGKFIRFIELFNEVTPRHKPSVLVYDYDLDERIMILLVSKKIDDQGLLAKTRLQELKSEGTILPSSDNDELSYTPSESQAQKVLASLQEMKIFIER